MSVTALKTGKSVRDQVSAEEWEKRVDLAACYRLVHEFGMDEMIATHISTRVPGEPDAFLINPYGLLYEHMHASCFIKVHLDGKILFNPTEYNINEAGYVIHSAILRARRDVDCVIHTHTLAGMSVSAMKVGLLPIAQTAMRFSEIAYHEYEGVATDLDEQTRLVRDLGDREAMILRNHGLLVVAASIPEAFNNIYRFERACQLQVMTLACNTEIVLPPKKLVDATTNFFAPGARRRFGLLEWPGLLAKLDRIDPSYRN
jgi:ribulose-5-phosphate 4-epimerase/fuculose-1-phosphate aldolase